jgi:hypothetical protein
MRLTGSEALNIPGIFCVDGSIELFLGDDEPIRNLGKVVVKAFVVVMLLTVLHVLRPANARAKPRYKKSGGLSEQFGRMK